MSRESESTSHERHQRISQHGKGQKRGLRRVNLKQKKELDQATQKKKLMAMANR